MCTVVLAAITVFGLKIQSLANIFPWILGVSSSTYQDLKDCGMKHRSIPRKLTSLNEYHNLLLFSPQAQSSFQRTGERVPNL